MAKLISRSPRVPTLTDSLYGTNSIGTVEGRIAIQGVLDLFKSTVNSYSSQQFFESKSLVDSANISWNLDTNQVVNVTLGGNRILDNPSNMKNGATYILRVIQDGAGSRSLSFGSAYKWAGGVAPTLSTGSGAVDIITFISDGVNMYGIASLDFS